MDDPAQLSEYGNILLMAIVGFLLVCGTLFLSKIISPKNPNPEKLSTYECGEESLGSAWVQFNPRFYVIALVFLLFDVELIFVFPWATVFGNTAYIQADARWGWFTLMEMGIFLGVLILGLIFVWRKGDLNWIKAPHVTPTVSVNIPESAYSALNNRVYQAKDHAIEKISDTQTASLPKVKSAVGYKPLFKKST